ncbi:hypothetical protein A2U01_0093930, partial [Trifolium medium]|nr:hypothetical protein [Trifolium medium]
MQEGSYAYAVNKGNSTKHHQGEISYDADGEELAKLQMAFVGVVENPGMTYNIQELFHS